MGGQTSGNIIMQCKCHNSNNCYALWHLHCNSNTCYALCCHWFAPPPPLLFIFFSPIISSLVCDLVCMFWWGLEWCIPLIRMSQSSWQLDTEVRVILLLRDNAKSYVCLEWRTPLRWMSQRSWQLDTKVRVILLSLRDNAKSYVCLEWRIPLRWMSHGTHKVSARHAGWADCHDFYCLIDTNFMI